MFLKVKEVFNKLVSKKSVLTESAMNEEELDNLLCDIQENVSHIDFESYPDPEVIDNKKDKTIFFLDDINNMWYLYNKDIEEIKEKHDKNILEEFNIVKCFGQKAGFIAHKLTSNKHIKIDYAILDITLGYGVKLKNGEYVEYDGIDVFMKLYKDNPDLKFIFCTAHTLNIKNPTVGYYFKKFEDKTGLNFKDYYVSKNSNRKDPIFKMLYGE